MVNRVAYDEFIIEYCIFLAVRGAGNVSFPVSDNFLTLVCKHHR